MWSKKAYQTEMNLPLRVKCHIVFLVGQNSKPSPNPQWLIESAWVYFSCIPLLGKFISVRYASAYMCQISGELWWLQMWVQAGFVVCVHCIDQSEASIEVTWSVLTNQRRVLWSVFTVNNVIIVRLLVSCLQPFTSLFSTTQLPAKPRHPQAACNRKLQISNVISSNIIE